MGRGREEELIVSMGEAGRHANFPDSLVFTVLDDRVSSRYSHKREGLPLRIAQIAETTEVYGSAPSRMFRNLIDIKPKMAIDLRYIVTAEVPIVSSSELLRLLKQGEFSKEALIRAYLILEELREIRRLGQGRANQKAAGMVDSVLSIVNNKECTERLSKFLRAAVFYEDSRGRAQIY